MYTLGVRAIQVLSAGAFALACSFARPAVAQTLPLERDPSSEASAHGSDARATKLRLPQRQVARQPRLVHPNYVSLTAGVVLFAFSYAVALADPLRNGFEGQSGRRAIPLAGPWFSKLTWPWALDGVLQVGGVAFITNAFVQPVTVLGTPAAKLDPLFTRQLRLSGTFDL
jgi:hypothetical protein